MLTRNCTQRMNAGIKARLDGTNTLAIYFLKPKLVDVNGIKYEMSSDLEVQTTTGTTVEVQSNFYPNNAYQRIGYDDYSEVSDKINGDAYSFLWIGTGDTKETMYDYKLSVDVDKNDFKHIGASYSMADEGWFTANRILKYIGENDIVIKEVGWFVTARSYMGSTYIQPRRYEPLLPNPTQTPYMFMMAREVLTNPITVRQGEIFSINMLIG